VRHLPGMTTIAAVVTAITVLFLAGCQNPAGSIPGGYTPPTNITAVFTKLTADGSALETTTKLTLTFDKDIAGLSAADITLDGGSTEAIKGTLTRTKTGVYDLAVGGIITSGSITVAVSKPGYNITGGPKTATVYRYVSPTDIPVTFVDLTADGSATVTTTKLTLTFNKDIDGLTVEHITLDARSTGAIKGSLTQTETGVYDLTVSGISSSGSVTVAVSKPGYNITGGSKTVAVFIITDMIVTNTAEWDTALMTIRNGGNGTAANPKTYTITVIGDVPVPGSTDDSFGSVSNVSITIRGSGKLYLTSPGCIIMIYNQAVYIDSADLTLEGLTIGQNDSAVNNNTSVVYVAFCTLELRNGTISGNTSSSYGGGVYVGSSRTFTKTGGGTIYGYTNGDAKSNVVKDSSGVVQNNRGHAVYVASSPSKRRETTAGTGVNLDSSVAGTAGGWED